MYTLIFSLKIVNSFSNTVKSVQSNEHPYDEHDEACLSSLICYRAAKTNGAPDQNKAKLN